MVLAEPAGSLAPLWHALLLGGVFFSSALLLFKRKNF